MGGKTAIALGLVAGLVVGGLIVGGVIALAPVPGLPTATTAPAASVAPAPSSAPPAEPSGGVASPAASPPTSLEPSASTAAEAFGIGEPAPPLALPLVGGDAMDLADYRGKPVWVNFMATWCPSCVDELPSMAGFAARYEDTGLVILAVDVKEDEATAQAFFQDLEIYFPVGLDSDGVAQRDWGALALPVHYWVDADGIVRDAALGGIGPDIMAQGLGSILPGVTVTP
jgi:thiol-disulfide isomerase/thioredoxin